MAVHLDTRVYVKATQELRSTLASLEKVLDVPEELLEANDLSVPQMKVVHGLMKRGLELGVDLPYRFHELVTTAEIKLPSPVYAERNPELEARCQRLRIEQENREYKRMTEGVDRKHAQRDDEPFAKQSEKSNQRNTVLIFAYSEGAK